jgi:hypothetical protein
MMNHAITDSSPKFDLASGGNCLEPRLLAQQRYLLVVQFPMAIAKSVLNIFMLILQSFIPHSLLLSSYHTQLTFASLFGVWMLLSSQRFSLSFFSQR